MANDYYNFTGGPFIPGTKARSDAVNTEYQAIVTAFEMLPDDGLMDRGVADFAGDSAGSGNAYTVSMPTTRLSNQDGDQVVFVADRTNTDAVTLNVDGIGAVSVVGPTGDALIAGDITSGLIYVVRYDSTNTRFQIMQPLPGYDTDAAASAAAAAASAAAAATSETNAATSETNAATSETNAGTSETNADSSATEAYHWAQYAEDALVPEGDLATEYSAYHWAQKASATAAAAVAAHAADLADTSDTAKGDDLIGVKIAVTNAVAATQHDLNETRFWNVVTDFGIDNTGSGDISTDWASMVSGIETDNVANVIFCPSGTYLVSADLDLPDGYCHVIGAKWATNFSIGANNVSVFAHTGAATTEFFFGVQDLRITNPGATYTNTRAIELIGQSAGTNRLSNIWLSDLYLSQHTSAGVYIQNCANVFATNVFMTNCATGWRQDDCADVTMVNIEVQNGSGIGYYFTGTTGATTYDEGLRMTNCNTNGQGSGLKADNMDWVNISNCSWTTFSGTAAAGGGCDLNACSNWNLHSVHVAHGSNTYPGFNLDSSCSYIAMVGCKSILNSYGIINSSDNLICTAFQCHNNTNNDLYTIGSYGYFSVQLDSTGVAASIVEASGADYNVFNGTVNGTKTIIGANSVDNTITY